MAKATAHCTCDECGKNFEKTTTKSNRREAINWEEWAVKNFNQCPKCWSAAQRAKEAAASLALVVNCDPYGQRIILHFEGNTMDHKDEIKALGYRWDELPSIGTFGYMSIRRGPLAWHLIIELEQLQAELDKVTDLRAVLKVRMTDIDVALYRDIKSRNDAKKAEEAAKKAEIEAEKSAVPRPKVPEKLAGTKWNQQIYGKKGGYRIYPNGVEVKLTDSEADEVKEYLIAKEVYKAAIAEIK